MARAALRVMGTAFVRHRSWRVNERPSRARFAPVKLGDFIREHRALIEAKDDAAFLARFAHPFLLVEQPRTEKEARALRSLETESSPPTSRWAPASTMCSR